MKMYSKCQANGPNGKQADVWKHYTPIEVRGVDGKVMLNLAICHHCSMAYQTGKWDSEKGRRLTLRKHYRKCSDQHHEIP